MRIDLSRYLNVLETTNNYNTYDDNYTIAQFKVMGNIITKMLYKNIADT